MLAHFSHRPKFETWLDWKSRLFDSTKGGERKQEREDHIQEMLKATPKARFVVAKFCNFICFLFLFVIIKKGEIVEAT